MQFALLRAGNLTTAHPTSRSLPTLSMSADVERFRHQLLLLRERLQGDVARLTEEALHKGGGEASGGLSNVPLHMADLGTDNSERENTLNLVQNQEQVLDEIADAFDRIAEKRFGLCEECGQPIPQPRLQALPHARHCVACARKLQPGV